MKMKYLRQLCYMWERVKDINKVKFLHFTQTCKTMTPVECDNLCGYNIIPRATTKKAIQRDRLKNNKNKSK